MIIEPLRPSGRSDSHSERTDDRGQAKGTSRLKLALTVSKCVQAQADAPSG